MRRQQCNGRLPRIAAPVALIVALAAFGGARAEDAPSGGSQAAKTGAGMQGNVSGAGSGSGQGDPKTIVAAPAQDGVAGTGMGKTPPKGDAPGTGQSVKGQPGQAVTPMQTP